VWAVVRVVGDQDLSRSPVLQVGAWWLVRC
jgi:hypothetical protein